MSNRLVGNIEAFDANGDDFPCHTERMEQCMLANITDQKRETAIFLTLVGGKTCNLLRDLASSAKPADRTEILRNH